MVDDPPDVQPPSQQITQTETLNMSQYSGMVNIRVLMDGLEIYNENQDVTMDPWVDVTVSGTGSKTLAVYVDGTLAFTQPVNFGAP